MRVIRATINCFSHSLASPLLDREIPLELTSKGLFLVNLNDIVQAAAATKPSFNAATKIASETFLAAPEKSDADVNAVSECSEPSNVNATKPNSQTTAEITPPFSSDIQRSGQNLHPATKLPAQDPSERTAIRKDLERHVVFAEPPEGTPGRSGCSTDGPVPSESDRLGTGEGQLWPEASGPYVQSGMGGSAMHQLHGVEVRRVQSDESPPVDPICGAQGGSPRSSPSSDPSVASQRVSSLSCRDHRPFWTQIHPANAKAYAGGFRVPTSAMDEELQELAEFEIYSSGTIPPVPMPLSQDPDFQAMTKRMLHMETALTKVLCHLEDQTEKKTD